MTATTHKIIVDVTGIDEDGNQITQSFRLPTYDDWQKNLISLNKKILKKFKVNKGYALRINRNIIEYDDYKSLSDIIKHSDFMTTPKIEIVDKKLLNKKPSNKQQERRKLIVHSDNKQKQKYTFTLPLDINESDDNIYSQLITEIKQKFKINNNQTLKLYENCNGKHIEIDDWDDLYESLQNTKLSESLNIYLQITSSHNIEDTEHKSPSITEQTQISIPSIYSNQSYIMNNIDIKPIDRTSKIVLLGDSGVGKTAIEQRFVWNRFSEWMEPTVGAMFSRRTLDYGDYRFTFEIWDTAGQDRFKSLTPLYYRNATAALIVYDITDYKTYNNALKWMNQLYQYDEDIVIALCGNKLDLYQHRKVPYNMVKKWIVKHNIAIFGETSAKTDVNITQIFRKIGEVIVKTTEPKQKSGFQIDEDYNDKCNDGEYEDNWCYSYCQII